MVSELKLTSPFRRVGGLEVTSKLYNKNAKNKIQKNKTKSILKKSHTRIKLTFIKGNPPIRFQHPLCNPKELLH